MFRSIISLGTMCSGVIRCGEAQRGRRVVLRCDLELDPWIRDATISLRKFETLRQ